MTDFYVVLAYAAVFCTLKALAIGLRLHGYVLGVDHHTIRKVSLEEQAVTYWANKMEKEDEKS